MGLFPDRVGSYFILSERPGMNRSGNMSVYSQKEKNMTKRTMIALGLALVLFAPVWSFSADTHSVFKYWSSWYGREGTIQAEIWIGTDRQSTATPFGTEIVRKDLGILWSLSPRTNVCREYALKPATGPNDPGTSPTKPKPGKKAAAETTAPKEDLRFVGGFDDPPMDWSVKEIKGETIMGTPCRVFIIKGDSDLSSVDARLWVSPDGKKDGRAASMDLVEKLAIRQRDDLLEKVREVMDGFPEGGIVKLEKTSNPSIGPLSKGRLTRDTYEQKDAPAGTYEIPAGYKKEAAK